MTKKIKGLVLIVITFGVMMFGGFCKKDVLKEKRFENHDEVVKYINDTYYSEDLYKFSNRVKSCWKGDRLLYATEYHTEVSETTGEGLYCVSIFDDDLNLRKVIIEKDPEMVWEDAHNFIKGL